MHKLTWSFGVAAGSLLKEACQIMSSPKLLTHPLSTTRSDARASSFVDMNTIKR